jgi:hypothetical protein
MMVSDAGKRTQRRPYLGGTAEVQRMGMGLLREPLMRWFKKKKTAADIEAEAKAIFDLCVEAFRRTWSDLEHHSGTPEAVAAEIEEFSQTAFRFMFTKFPLTKEAVFRRGIRTPFSG